MLTEQSVYTGKGFSGAASLGERAQWVLVFGAGELLCDNALIDGIRIRYPQAYIMGCSTAGEINDSGVTDRSLCVTAIAFKHARIAINGYDLGNLDNHSVGQRIISDLVKEDLKHVFVLSEGLNVNGSQLVQGIRSVIDPKIPVTGGLAGDGTAFGRTYLLNNGYSESNQVVVAALYGDIRIGCASFGGWNTFGIERIATKTKNNILYELDGRPALDLYKEYLGEKSDALPASALLFPLSVRIRGSEDSYVRTILGVDEDKRSLIFAGDIPMNAYCRLMKSNAGSLISGSMRAAELGMEMLGSRRAELAILVSCVGRKLVLKQRIDEEIEVVREIVGDKTTITGFYSYGEISPYKMNTHCELHNQTMTVTLMSEE